MKPGNPQSIKANGWCQGAIIDRDFAKELCDSNNLNDFDADQDIAILISHDCDIVNPNYGAEPFVELLVAKPILSTDGRYTDGRNPRKLQFSVGDDVEQAYEASIHDQIKILRNRLEPHFPCQQTLPSKIVKVIRHWVASRYTRHAFPDLFNERIRSAGKKIDNLLKNYGGALTSIYLILHSMKDVNPDEDYEIIIVGTILPDDIQSSLEGDALEVMDKIGMLLDECEGISVIDSPLKTESEITLTDLRYMKKWSYDYMSFRDKPGGEIAPEL